MIYSILGQNLYLTSQDILPVNKKAAAVSKLNGNPLMNITRINSTIATERNDIFIDGKFVAAHSSKRIALTDPATEEVFGHIVDSDEADLDRAVHSARQALPAWQETSPKERAGLLAALADAFESRRDQIVELVSKQNGAVISWPTQWDGLATVASYRQSAADAENLRVEEVREAYSRKSISRYEPVGVIGAIVPWNAPQILLAGKLGPALAAGCTVVVKPSPETSLDSLLVGELLNEAGVPAGVVNIVTGGRETGAAVVKHKGTDAISFTGSTLAGQAIAVECGKALKPVTAELGGKSAAVLLDDADLDAFQKVLISTCLPNTGQVCFACTRILVPRSRYKEVLDLVVTTLREAPMGNPQNPESLFGPLVTARQRERVEGYIRSGLSEGARLALGGGRPEALSVGYYVEPTVFTDVSPGMRIFQEEIFGPVLVIVPHDNDDDAVRLANDSIYGLYGSVYSRDIERATDVARKLETGTIKINNLDGVGGWNPYKASGLGRLGGLQGAAVYQQVKSISQSME